MKNTFHVFIFLCSALCAAQSTFTNSLDPDSQADSLKMPVQGRVASPSLNREPGLPGESPQAVIPAVPSTRVVGPLTTKSEFQQFAEDTAGRQLPVYGRQLFDQVPTTFAPADQIPVPSDYVIGPGDEILIRIWGKVDFEGHLTVDRSGQISLPKIGTLNVAGLRFNQLEGRIRSEVSNLYRDFEVNVTLGRLRSIQVYILGSARQPGSYTVSSLSTLVNVLFISGGPSATGSMRHVELRRGTQTVAALDLYDLLRNGDKSHDAQLLPGDVIYIPPVGRQMAVFGSVNEPGIYELSADESVSSVLHCAGGLTALADTQKAVIEHIVDHRKRSIDEFALGAADLARRVQDGDILKVLPLSPEFENAVTLRGNVARPGRYPWHEQMRVSDLIPDRNALISREYWNQTNHILPTESVRPFSKPVSNRVREEMAANAENEREFRSNDIINKRPQSASRRSEESPTNPTEIASGQGQSDAQNQNQPTDTQPGKTADADETPTVATVGKITAEINWEYAVVERLDRHDLSTHLIPFRLAGAIDDHASADNQILMAGDVVTIFSRADLDLPMEKHAFFVRVGGEVNAPGVYRVNPGDTLQDAVRLSGGLTSHSYLYASKFTRVSVRHTEEEQLRQSSEQMQRELMSRYAGATPVPGQTGADQQAQLMLQQAAIARLSAIKPTGRVVLQIKPMAAELQDVPALPLEDGDTFYVPPKLSTVQVAGAVYNPNAFRYQDGKRLIDYLNSAGGATREADKKRVFVIRADGTVISKQVSGSHFHAKFENLKLLPGDAIVVPEKLKTPGNRALQDTVQIISQGAITAAALSAILP